MAMQFINGEWREVRSDTGIFRQRTPEEEKARLAGVRDAAIADRRSSMWGDDPSKYADPVSVGGDLARAGRQAVADATRPVVSELSVQYPGMATIPARGGDMSPQQALQEAERIRGTSTPAQAPNRLVQDNPQILTPEERAARVEQRAQSAIDAEIKKQQQIDRSGSTEGKMLSLELYHQDPSITKAHRESLAKVGDVLAGGTNALTADDMELVEDVLYEDQEFDDEGNALPLKPKQLRGQRLSKLEQRFRRALRSDSKAAESDLTTRLGKENPEDRASYFKILDEVAAAHPLSGFALKDKYADKLPEAVTHSEKLAREMAGKELNPLATAIGAKSNAELTNDLAWHDAYLKSELNYTDEQIAAKNQDLQAGDPDAISDFKEDLAQKPSINDAIKERKENQAKYRVHTKATDTTKEEDMKILKTDGNLSDVDAYWVNAEVPDRAEGTPTYRLAAMVNGGVSTIESAADFVRKSMSDNEADPDAAVAAAVNALEEQGALSDRGLNEDGRKEIGRLIRMELKRRGQNAVSEAEDVAGQARGERMNRVKEKAASVKLPGAGDAAWGSIYDNGVMVTDPEDESEQIVSTTRTATQYFRNMVDYDTMPKDEQEYIDAAIDAVENGDDKGTNSAYFLPVTSKIIEIKSSLEGYMASKKRQEAAEEVEEQRLKDEISAQAASSGLEARFYRGINKTTGKPTLETVTFRASDPVEVRRMREWETAGDDGKADIAARQARRHAERAEAVAKLDETVAQIRAGRVFSTRAMEKEGSGEFESVLLPRQAETEQDWDEQYSLLEQQYGGFPELFSEADIEFRAAKKKWQDGVIKDVMKQDKTLTELDARKLVEDMADASEEWMMTIPGIFKGTPGSEGGRETLEKVGAIETDEKNLRTKFVGSKRELKPDTEPPEYSFGSMSAYEKVSDKIPDGTQVIVGGKKYIHSTEEG